MFVINENRLVYGNFIMIFFNIGCDIKRFILLEKNLYMLMKKVSYFIIVFKF